MRGCFVTGTDTGVGKSVLTAAIIAALRIDGVPVRALKPIITGLAQPPDGVWPADHELLAQVAGCRPDEVTLAGYGPAVSPHLAAQLAGDRISVASLVERIRLAGSGGAALVVEGVGGLLVPLDANRTVRDLARELALPVLVAARAGLGTINHTLLTLEAARAGGLQVAGVVLTPWPARPGTLERSNRETIERLGKVEVQTLGTVDDPAVEPLAVAARDLPLERWLRLETPPRGVAGGRLRGGAVTPPGAHPLHRAHDAASDRRRGYVCSMPTTDELIESDRRHLWHPFTQQQGWCRDEPPLVIDHAAGTNLYDSEGRAYIDGVSSLWCNVHGHRHPAIDEAIRAQLEQVSHCTLLGLSHGPAIELAERLISIAPAGLQRVFYSDSGSAAVEIALKMAFQWWAQRGEQQRTRFICLRDAYHGDTLGAVSVGGIDLFHSLYRPLLFEALHARAGDPADLQALLSAHAGEVAAVIVEPLVQGAAGMLLQPPGYLRRVRELCTEHRVMLICDEVATGFGRTGRMFACQHEDVLPDLLCVGKGLTGGYLPLAATLATEQIYDGFLGSFEEFRTFFHGHTFTGNPLACAAAIATLKTFESERTLELLQPKIGLLSRLLEQRVAALPGVAEVRQRGMMVGIELLQAPASERLGHRVALAARHRGAIIRPLGDVVVLMPPLAISEPDLRRLVAITASAIAEVSVGRVAHAAA